MSDNASDQRAQQNSFTVASMTQRIRAPWLVCALALSTLHGCASLNSSQQSAADDVVAVEQPVAAEEPVYRPIPAPTLYSLLVAEIAGQRQRYDISLYNYLDQARKTNDPAVAERALRIAQFVGSVPHAVEAAGLWLESDPENPAAQQAAAHLAIEQRRYSEAMVHLEKLLQLTGISQFDYLAATTGSVGVEEQRAVLNDLEIYSERYPTDATLWYARAILEQNLNQFDTAIEHIDYALKLDPEQVSAAVQKGRILAATGQNEAAVKWLDKVQKKHPDNKPAAVLHAKLLLQDHSIEEARDAFLEVNERFPDDSSVILSLGLIEEELGNIPAAREHLLMLVERQQYLNEAHFYLGRIAENEKDPELAISHYEQVTESREFLPSHLNASRLISDEQGLNAARVYLNDMRRAYPKENTNLTRIEVELLSKDGEKEEAMNLISHALATEPNNTDLLYTRAMLAEQLENFDLLESDLRYLIKLEPNHSEALNALGYSLADRTDRFDEALPLIQRALELAPNNPAIIDSLGWLYFRQGNIKDAGPLLARAFELMEDHEIAAHYGEYLWAIGEQDEAWKIWKQGLKQRPDSSIIKRTLERLNLELPSA